MLPTQWSVDKAYKVITGKYGTEHYNAGWFSYLQARRAMCSRREAIILLYGNEVPLVWQEE